MRKYFVFTIYIRPKGDLENVLPSQPHFVLFNTLEEANQYNQEKSLDLFINAGIDIREPTRKYPYPHVVRTQSDQKKFEAYDKVERAMDFWMEDCREMLFYEDQAMPSGTVLPVKHAQYKNDHHPVKNTDLKMSFTRTYQFGFDYIDLHRQPAITQIRKIYPEVEWKLGPPSKPHTRKIPDRYREFIDVDADSAIDPKQLRLKLIKFFTDYYHPSKFNFAHELVARFFTCHLGRHSKNIMLAKKLVTELSAESKTEGPEEKNEEGPNQEGARLLRILWMYRALAFHENPHGDEEDEEFNDEGSFIRRLEYAITTSYSILTKGKNETIKLGPLPKEISNLGPPDGKKSRIGQTMGPL